MAEMTPEQWRKRLGEAPYPCTGWPIDKRDLPMDRGYALAGEALARAMLLAVEDDPTLLDVPSREEDPSGIDRAQNDKLWEGVMERWPELNDWIGGVTGFQYGWAHNIVRYVVGAEPVGNPAIVTVGPGPGEESSSE